MSQTCTCDATSSSGAHAVHCQLTARPIISVLACDHAGMIVRCNWCFAVLEEPGALVFTPPDRLGQCTKIHVCVECFKRVILSATPKRSDDGALPKSLLEDLKRCAAEARRQAGTEGGTTCSPTSGKAYRSAKLLRRNWPAR